VKLYATTKELQEKVAFVTHRSLEYMLLAFETCYTYFQDRSAVRVVQEV